MDKRDQSLWKPGSDIPLQIDKRLMKSSPVRSMADVLSIGETAQQQSLLDKPGGQTPNMTSLFQSMEEKLAETSSGKG